jgi:hypothetical protein
MGGITMRIYHGSIVDITDKYLQPNKAFELAEYPPTVYASTQIEYAVLYSLNPIKSFCKKYKLDYSHIGAFSCNIIFPNSGTYSKDIPILCEIYSGMFEELYNKCPTFIYELDVEEQKMEINGFECKIDHQVEIVNKRKIDNVFNELLRLEEEGKIMIERYAPTNWRIKHILEDGMEYRAEHCASKDEARFFKKNFSNYRQIIDSIPYKFLE